MMPWFPRVLTAALAVCLLVLAASAAAADEWVLVVDADAIDAAQPETHPDAARALASALAERKTTMRLLAARHPVLALSRVAATADEDEPQVVVLVGAFAELPGATDTALEKAKAKWAADAPSGSRVLALHTVADTAYKTLEGVDGLAVGGSIVLGFGEPQLETAPFSPLDPARELRATVTLPTTVLRLAGGEAGADPLKLASAYAGDRITSEAAADGSLRFEVRRGMDGPRTAEVAFQASEASKAPDPDQVDPTPVIVLADPPAALTWTWDRLLADSQLLAADGSTPRPVDAKDTEASSPREMRYRLVATKPAMANLEATVHVDDALRPVPGLRVWIEGRTARDEEVVEAALHVRYAPKRAAPQDVTGEIRVGAHTIPFHVSTDVGRALLIATPPAGSFALPHASKRATVRMEVQARNGNMPPETRFQLTCEPEAFAGRIRLRVFKNGGAEQRVAPGAQFTVPTDGRVEVTVELRDLDAWGALGGGTLHIRPAPQPGTEVTGSLTLPYRFREATLQVVDPEPRYRLVDGAVEPVRPLRLRLDADGGDGAWLLARLQRPPQVTERATTPRSDWVVVEEGSGTWRVEARGAWRGIAPEPFAAAEAGVTFQITWDGGDAPDDVQATIDVPARWGTRGWVFVGLAVLAIALGVGTFLQLRAAPVRGTLLYAVQGLERTVGRVDLTPIGRRPAVLTSDERGRVDIGGEGDPIATIRPTRVGAMLDVPGTDGEPDRRLLVDGLSVRTGRHTLRYVSGDAEDVEAAMPALEVPDLLGPEFDLESGSMDALPGTTT